MTILLISLCAAAIYSYVLYPLTLAALVAVRKRAAPNVQQSDDLSVSLIIAVHNEAARIGDKLTNALALDYPRLQIVVASDCSTDATDDIVRSFADKGVVLTRSANRNGKEYAQRQAVSRASGEVLVFTDVGTTMAPDAIKRIARYFSLDRIGAVSSEDKFIRDDGTLVGEGAYVRYEMLLRRLESQLAGLVGLSGSFFAARRRVCEGWDAHTPSDFNTALSCARLGLKAVTAPDVIGYYRDLKNPAGEYDRKVRTVLRGITGLVRNHSVLSPARYGLFAWQVFSHKVMRWLVPVFLIALLAVSVAGYDRHWSIQALVVAQLMGYTLALLAHWVERVRAVLPIKLLHYFCQANLAIVHAAWRYLAGHRMTVWQPSAR